MKSIQKISDGLLHVIFIGLMILAVVLYKERLFADASYYLFHAINKGWFHIEHGRTVLGISQVLPILGSWLNLPLKIVLVLASIGHELFYYSISLIALYQFRDRAAAYSVLVIHLIGQLWLYYSPMLEICYGAALAVLFYSLLKSGKASSGKWLIFLMIVQWFAMMSHPENFLLIAVAIAYDFINQKNWKPIHFKASLFLVIAFVIEVLTFSDYERGHTKITDEQQPTSALNLLDGKYLGEVGDLFLTYYPDLICLFGITLLLLIVKREGKKGFVFLGSIVFLIAIVNQASPANEFGRYNESMYNPLVFIVVLFFMYELAAISNKTFKSIGFFLILAIAVFRAAWIFEFSKPLQQRMAQLERLVNYAQQLGHSKYLINSDNFHTHYTSITWANPIETLLLSASDGADKAISIAENGEYYYNKNYKVLNDSNYMFRRFEVKPYSFLNDRYFRLKKGRYHYLNNEGLEKPIKEYIPFVSIAVLDKNIRLKAGDTSYVFVKIINDNVEKLPSAEKGLNIACHWYKGGEVYNWDGIRTSLEVDVFGNYEQHIKIAVPKEAGKYELVPDMVLEGKAWFMMKEKFLVEVE